MKTRELSKDFMDICTLIREGENEVGIQRLKDYRGFESQKNAILAEIEYFNGNFKKALEYDIEVIPYFNEWYYSNVMNEHVAAMSYVSKKIGKENLIINEFQKQINLIEENQTTPIHIKKPQILYYEKCCNYIITGDFFKTNEYKPNKNIMTMEEIEEDFRDEYLDFDMNSDVGQQIIFEKCCIRGTLEDMLKIYDKIRTVNVKIGTTYLIKIITAYQYLEENEKAFEVILKLARNKDWYIASHTQVMPMEFFTYPCIMKYLDDKSCLEKILDSIYKS